MPVFPLVPAVAAAPRLTALSVGTVSWLTARFHASWYALKRQRQRYSRFNFVCLLLLLLVVVVPVGL